MRVLVVDRSSAFREAIREILDAVPAHPTSSVSGEPEVEAAVRAATQRFATALVTVLERGRAAGDLRADLYTDAAAWWLLSLVASQRFRRATAPDAAGTEARLAAATLIYS